MNSDPHENGAVLHTGAPLSEATLAMVLLHGRGGSAEDILGLAPAFRSPGIAFLAPQAANGSWYPLSFMAPRQGNEPFLTSALKQVEAVVRSIEAAGIERKRIVIAGFSQGACLSSEFVARHPAQYGGLIAFTGGLIGPPGSIPAISPETGTPLAGTPAFFGSGDPDPHVPWARVEESAAVLHSLGADVEARRYPGRAHTISQEELRIARSWVLDRVRS